MSAVIDTIRQQVRACAIDVCWREWQALAGLRVSGSPVLSIIDPEALVLLSLAVRRAERRLDDQLLWWASHGCSLLSVQRMRTLLDHYPESSRHDLAWFSSLAVAAGDPRWQVLLDGTKHRAAGRPGKGPAELQLLEPSTLMLRLRAGFGVGAKADLLAFLIGAASAVKENSAWATVEVLSKATSYSIASVRRAVTEMALARLVDASRDRPAQYSVDTAAWATLMHLKDPARSADGWTVPQWRFWSQMFALLAACLEWGERGAQDKVAPLVLASHARDIVERFQRPLSWNRIESEDARLHPGEQYLCRRSLKVGHRRSIQSRPPPSSPRCAASPPEAAWRTGSGWHRFTRSGSC